MPHYVEIPADELKDFCASLGMRETRVYDEIVYERHSSKNEFIKFLVYTSIRVGRDSARKKGKDSIKVCAVDCRGRGARGYIKAKRIHRTGSVEGVLSRIKDRLREVVIEANSRLEREEDIEWKRKFAEVERDRERQAYERKQALQSRYERFL